MFVVKRCLQATLMLILSYPTSADENCTMCHAQHLSEINHTLASVGCQGCHDDANQHPTNPMGKKPSQTFAEQNDASDQNTACLGCHNSQATSHWIGSGHETADLTCHNCHNIHKPKGSECLSCHQEVSSSLKLPHRHPVREGKISCNDCHNPHGSSNDSALSGHLPTETCINCHKEFRAPVLFEHDPVTEDCSLCHSPHGSTNDSLLNTRVPFLCQQCHLAADHPTTLNDAAALQRGSSNLLVRGCLNCHSQVHGSNHPGGAALTR